MGTGSRGGARESRVTVRFSGKRAYCAFRVANRHDLRESGAIRACRRYLDGALRAEAGQSRTRLRFTESNAVGVNVNQLAPARVAGVARSTS